MQDLIKIDGTLATVTAVNPRSGASTLRLKTAKEFKAEFKVSNPKASAKDTKLAFESYTRTESSKLANSFDFQKAIRLAAEGKLGIKRVTANKAGDASTVVFLDLSKDATAGVKQAVDGLTVEDAKRLLEYIQSKLPTTTEVPQ